MVSRMQPGNRLWRRHDQVPIEKMTVNYAQMEKNMLPTNLFCELSDYDLISVSGPDAAKFLQGQITCDVRQITATQSNLSAYCNPKGRVLALFRIFYSQEKYYLLLPTIMVEPTLKLLKKFAAFSKVSLTIETNWIKFVAAGAEVEHALAKQFLNLPTQVDTVTQTETAIIIKIPGQECRYLIFATTNLPSTLTQRVAKFSNKFALDLWRLQNIAAGIPEIFPATVGMFTPHMLNLDQLEAMSLHKGCYVGQEIIARTQYLGKSKRRLMKIIVLTTQNIVSGASIVNNQSMQEMGQLVNGINFNESYFGLAVLPEEMTPMNLPLEAVWNEGVLSLSPPKQTPTK